MTKTLVDISSSDWCRVLGNYLAHKQKQSERNWSVAFGNLQFWDCRLQVASSPLEYRKQIQFPHRDFTNFVSKNFIFLQL